MVGCQKPADCPNEVCCGTVMTGAGTFPNCAVGSAVSSCKTSCKTSIPFSCNSTIVAAVCDTKADCKDPASANCCTFAQGGLTNSACVGDLFKSFAKSCN
jgi:hypothetical protein